MSIMIKRRRYIYHRADPRVPPSPITVNNATVMVSVSLPLLSTLALLATKVAATTGTSGNNYIVTFKDTTSFKSIQDHLLQHSLSALFDKQHSNWNSDNDYNPEVHWIPESDGTPLIWYQGEFTDAMLAKVKEDPMVEGVYEDVTISLPEPLGTATHSDVTTERNWGLTRVSNRGKMDATKKPTILKTDGQGVNVYILDTGIETKHPEFESRATFGTSFIKTDPTDSDHNGHSTHVASSVAGKTFGVAPSAKLVSVKVLDGSGSGSLSGVMAGIEWVIKDHKLRKNAKSVANMSLGSGRHELINRAVNSAVDAGVHMVVAAGNSNRDACLESPSSAEKVVSVGASTKEDKRASFSNYGNCVSVYAPGHEITGAWLNGSTRTISGTSMASPHVAGVIAALLSRSKDSPTPQDMRKAIIKTATMGVLSDPLVKNSQGLAFTCPKACSTWQCPKDKLKNKGFNFEDYLWYMSSEFGNPLNSWV